MDRRRVGVLLLVALVVVVAVGVASLVMGFVSGSLAYIYVSIAASAISPFLLTAGVGLVAVSYWDSGRAAGDADNR